MSSLRQLVVDWALDLKGKGESHGGAEGTISGIIGPMSCVGLAGGTGEPRGVCIDLRLEVGRWVAEVYGPVQSRTTGK